MNFDLSEEQQLVADSIERFVQDNYDLESRQAIVAQTPGFSETHWQTMSELGWLGLPFAEADGGFGGNQIDTMVLMEQFGKGLVLEPFLASIVLGGGVLKRLGSEVRRRHGWKASLTVQSSWRWPMLSLSPVMNHTMLRLPV